MNDDFWRNKWTSKDIGFNQAQPNKLMQRYFSSLNLKPGSRVFVPLCGKSIDMLWLAEQGYQVVGIELSELACSDFFADHQIPFQQTQHEHFKVYTSDNIIIYSGDFFKLNPKLLGNIDAVYDRAALIALPEEVRKKYAIHLMNLMKPAASMFLIITPYDKHQIQGPPFSVDENEVSMLYGKHFTIIQLYSKALDVPEHLKIRGLVNALEQAYSLTIEVKNDN